MSDATPLNLNVKALFFDVFGTLVDWRGGVAREAEALLAPLGYRLDWPAFADAWRGEYQTGMEEVRSGRIAFAKLDLIHRRNLDRILPRFGLGGAPEAALGELNLAWRRLDAWPDVAAGLGALREAFLIAPVSNGNISLLVALARRNGFPFDAILGAEIACAYKPAPEVYLSAAAALDLPPSACLMVAAHSDDLAAAAACGLRTAHIARPLEFGPGGKGERAPEIQTDFVAADISDLARRLGATE
ncbi:haloacid dehalogenase type II [Methylocella silvestris]|uniref:haloacid dehalogenase type II n=1 Tax=Methylocella silvestris TaxID=199596 RepID=UPI001FE0A13D|nr:haloacid dehalogenase type II [Methylocella silvestris]